MKRRAFDRRVLIERGVQNPREIEVSVLGNDSPVASVPGEVLPSRDFYSYESKYIDGTSELLIPAPISAELTAAGPELWPSRPTRRSIAPAWPGWTSCSPRRAGDSDELYLGELNTIPGFTQISMYPKLWEHSGLSYPALIDRLIELALERKIERDRTERRFHRES